MHSNSDTGSTPSRRGSIHTVLVGVALLAASGITSESCHAQLMGAITSGALQALPQVMSGVGNKLFDSDPSKYTVDHAALERQFEESTKDMTPEQKAQARAQFDKAVAQLDAAAAVQRQQTQANASAPLISPGSVIGSFVGGAIGFEGMTEEASVAGKLSQLTGSNNVALSAMGIPTTPVANVPAGLTSRPISGALGASAIPSTPTQAITSAVATAAVSTVASKISDSNLPAAAAPTPTAATTARPIGASAPGSQAVVNNGAPGLFNPFHALAGGLSRIFGGQAAAQPPKQELDPHAVIAPFGMDLSGTTRDQMRSTMGARGIFPQSAGQTVGELGDRYVGALPLKATEMKVGYEPQTGKVAMVNFVLGSLSADKVQALAKQFSQVFGNPQVGRNGSSVRAQWPLKSGGDAFLTVDGMQVSCGWIDPTRLARLMGQLEKRAQSTHG